MAQIISSLSAAGIGTVVLRPMPDVQPFSIVSGYSFEGILSDIRTWLRDDLVPYLQDNSASAIFQQNVDTMIDTVNAALTQQSSIVTAALNAAVHDVINGAIPVEDALVLAVLEDVSTTTRQWLETHEFNAPAPSAFGGAADQSVLQPLFDAAMTSAGIGSGPGIVNMRPGIYKGNFTLNAGNWAARIRGCSEQATYVQSLDASKAVFNIKGTSGALTSGSLEDLTIVGTSLDSTTRNGIGVELDGIGGFTLRRVEFINLAKGHRWIITTPGQFTEFCVLEDVKWHDVTLPVEYSGAGSYHGSGIDGHSIANLDPDALFMEIGAGCNVYSAPLSLTIFAPVGSTQGNFIVNRYGGPVYFFGALRVEVQGGEWYFAWVSGSYVYFLGPILVWGGPTHLGLLFKVDKVVSTGTAVIPHLSPWNTKQTLNTGTTPIMGSAPINGPATYDCSIEVFGPNGYWYSADVRCWASGTSVPAVVDVVREHYFNDPGSIGKPTFAWNNGLTLTQNNFNTNYIVSASYRVLLHMNPGDNLGQF